MKVIISGDRNWNDWQTIHDRLKTLPKNALIIHGGARGADLIADNIAKKLGLETKEYKADWDRFGKAAGPIRNSAMLEEEPDIVIAFHANINESKGTKDMLNQARKKHIVVQLITGS